MVAKARRPKVGRAPDRIRLTGPSAPSPVESIDPGTTLYTDRVILHNFFSKLKIDNPVNEVPRFPKFCKKPVVVTDEELKKFFGVCTPWERAFFALLLATGLRRGELQTLHWSDLDLARKRVHVTAKPDYGFIPKDGEERTVSLTEEVARLLRKYPMLENCPLVFPAPSGKPNWRFIHDRVKIVSKRAGLNPKDWHLHRFRDTAATRCSAPALTSGPSRPGSATNPSTRRRNTSNCI